MPKVHLLDKEVSELIAAGEVIERPSSVIKELVENSIDSGATAITVEIQQGGISYMRITDNGCGMSYDDVPTAFLRHATSKLSVKEDLSRILTLGFRGEALASVCAVSRVDCITKQKGDTFGTHYIIEAAEEKLHERTGCPDGTTIVIRDIFFNVPVRLRFLKKDKYEGTAISAILSKIAVSHPEISFRFIKDHNQELFTPGDNKLFSAVYSVFGKEFAASVLPVDYDLAGISVKGYTIQPLSGRKNRTMQHFFVNGRYVKSLTCMSAIEEAYRNTIMEGKFPACVIFMDVPPDSVDVNVHPAKIEVRFSDEKLIYDAVFFAVKNALLNEKRTHELVLEHTPRPEDYAMPVFTDKGGEQAQFANTSSSPDIRLFSEPTVTEKDVSAKRSTVASVKKQEPVHHDIRVEEIPADFSPKASSAVPENTEKEFEAAVALAEQNWNSTSSDALSEQESSPIRSDISEHISSGYDAETDIEDLRPEPPRQYRFINDTALAAKPQQPVEEKTEAEKEKYLRFIGEAFKNYAIAETEDSILIIDKHAAHERIRFERLRTGREELTAQMMLEPKSIRLDFSDYDAIVKNLRVCADLGFVIEAQQVPFVLVKGIPSMLDAKDAEDMVTEMAHNFAVHRQDPLPEILDEIYHSMSCKGAIKANDETSPQELADLFKQVLSDDRIRYCPHGRPIMFELTKYELEKQFKRVVQG
ncbi:MAG: DNA mismatch repair endonuclease MutL [Oscillospiraceae bacterium]|nr:DNA mismatch repair endonuclease MutL [Oscillospiraceae bacterium]